MKISLKNHCARDGICTMVALHIALKKKVNMSFFNKQARGKSATRVELPINTMIPIHKNFCSVWDGAEKQWRSPWRLQFRFEVRIGGNDSNALETLKLSIECSWHLSGFWFLFSHLWGREGDKCSWNFFDVKWEKIGERAQSWGTHFSSVSISFNDMHPSISLSCFPFNYW